MRVSYASPRLFELREDRATGKRSLVGYASIFNSASVSIPLTDEEGFIEYVAPGAFARSLASGENIVATLNHDLDRQIAQTSDGSLTLEEDRIGLYTEIRLDESRDGKAAYLLACEGRCGMSFTFSCRADSWTTTNNGLERTLLDVDISEICLTNDPCYESTWVKVNESKRSIIPVNPSLLDRYSRYLKVVCRN